MSSEDSSYDGSGPIPEERRGHKYGWSRPHPFYRRIGYLGFSVGMLWVLSKINASVFDITEIKTAAPVTVALVLREVAGYFGVFGKGRE